MAIWNQTIRTKDLHWNPTKKNMGRGKEFIIIKAKSYNKLDWISQESLLDISICEALSIILDILFIMFDQICVLHHILVI